MRQLSANSASIRNHNLSLILNLLRREKVVSRADLIRETQLSPAAVSALVNVLMGSKFVREVGVGASSGGRRPILLEFEETCRYVLGVDMGASHINTVVMDMGGKVIARCHRQYDVIPDPTGSIRLIVQLIGEALEVAHLSSEQLLGIGVTIPAPLTGEKLDRLMTYYMPAWEGVVLPDLIAQHYALSVSFDNDANAGALAEKWWGAGRGIHSLAFIKTGIGVGSGLVIHDEIYRGFTGAAGEIGNTTIDPDGRVCRCGNQGCMEAYVGVPGMIAAVVEARQQAGMESEDGEWSLQAIVNGALHGDPICRDVVHTAGEYLGIAIANLLNLFNPGKVILNGGLVAAGELFFQPVRDTIARRVLPMRSLQPAVVPSQLGEDAIAIGAATIALNNAFQPERLYHTLGLQERR